MVATLVANFYGPDNFFLESATLTGGAIDIVTISNTGTTLIIQNATTGYETTITGTGITVDAFGMPTGGSITGLSFDQGGTTIITITGLNWLITDFTTALSFLAAGSTTALDALYSAQPIKLYANAATTPIELDAANYTNIHKVFGTDFDDLIRGGSNNDKIFGRGGDDKIDGQGGDDSLGGSGGADLILGGTGNDTIAGGRGNDRLLGQDGDDTIVGAKGADLILGGKGFDNLNGGVGNDTLIGGKGSDSLEGGTGDDTLTGGKHADTFIFNAAFGNDTIVDYQDGSDQFDMRGLAYTFADVTVTASGTDTLLTTAAGTILLTGIATTDIDASDFIFV